MTWKKVSSLASQQHISRGLQASLVAGALCKQAEILYPELFHAISIKNKVLHIQVDPSKALAFKLIEGQMINKLNLWATKAGFPTVTRVQLTIEPS